MANGIDSRYRFRLDPLEEGGDPTIFDSQTLRDDPDFAWLREKYERALNLAALLDFDPESVDETRVDSAINALRERLRQSHPMISLLSQGREMSNEHVPLVLRLANPSLKDLNTAYTPALADVLMQKIFDLAASFFGSKDDGEPVLTFLNRTANGGNAMLHKNSPQLAGNTFEEMATQFQLGLQALVEDFDSKHGNRLAAPIIARMGFGVVEGWPLAEHPANGLSAQDGVVHFLYGAQLAGEAKDRHRPPWTNEEKRPFVLSHSAQRYVEGLNRALRRVLPEFKRLYEAKKDDQTYRALFVDVLGAPFLSLRVLDAIRKHSLASTFPFLAPEEVQCFEKLVRVLNRLEGMKPFLASNLDMFTQRLVTIAELLKENPDSLNESKSLVERLHEQALVSLKDRQESLDRAIEGTQLAVAERVYKTMCLGAGSATLVEGDGIGLGARDLQFTYMRLLQFFTGNEELSLVYSDPSFVDRFRVFLNEMGDDVTAYLRLLFERLSGSFGEVGVTVDTASTGDELHAVVPSRKASLEAFVRNNPVRVVAVDLPPSRLSIEAAAELWAMLTILAEEGMKQLKRWEHQNGKPFPKPVNTTIVQ